MNVAQAVGARLAALGVDQVFGVVGSGNLIVTDALCAGGARYLAARQETAAVAMADGYARVTGRLGVATVHQGPGLTNAMTAITEAAKSRTPVLVLAADTSAAAIRSNFRIDQDRLVGAVGAVAERVYTPQTAIADATRAYERAVTDRRTVVLMLPLDVQAAECPVTDPPPTSSLRRRPAPDSETVDEVTALLLQASRPVLLAGRGAVVGDAGAAIEALGERVGAIVATSGNGHGLFAGNPYSVGISGGLAPPSAAELLTDADLVVAFGASLNVWTSGHGSLFPKATLVQVDIDAEAVGAHRPVDVAVVADAATTARSLCDELDRRGHRSTGLRTPQLAAVIAAGRWSEQPFTDAGTAAVIDPRTFTIALEKMLPAERTVAVDSGHFMGWPVMYLSVPDAAGFVFGQAFQSVGLGLGAAIGAAAARPDRLTVAALGDGGAMMALGELDTVARLGVPMLIVVYDDAAYGAEVHHFRPHGQSVDLAQFPDTDLAALARGAGLDGVTVRTVSDLDAVKDWLGRRDRSLLIDAKVNPDVVGSWLEEAFRAH